ncbi:MULTISPECIES: SGNH/GDSL hydrolase family protein [Bradyrhizobium]|uniref:SGNH/GDSL hydrolase family protein n=1 Tax=Bradyrhizobium TaxID=374 RepID=UPI00048777D4|nr:MULTISPECIES: SGNH/GDSL hydrolase family protein [Bradyrhizobium]MCS3449424.1 lysophospholipase L1-like esterase [Bradyrhizobium elkanii]MCS3559433.1 lysophospholipase L1-like esterase [Bradyrhizobium elkanii]MCW2150721.1 lysophospholipase L1-like esterase [Bradyrhizobium elkanii]MCW2359220.1 lysophospholipase L1-like esterase [Bradyrhizobium elkanii]MCW2374452.1 lysophospholipase L1-like esterase [Bradyrhizobium elkanii]
MRNRFGEVSQHGFHDHAAVREFMIRAALADAPAPIVVLGDSITEMAPLPRLLCGRPVINAGVGGQTIPEAKQLAGRVLQDQGAFLLVLAVGANDAGSPTAQRDFTDLIDAVKPLSTRPLVVIAVAADERTNRAIEAAAVARGVRFIDPHLPSGAKMADGIHFTAAAYKAWVPALEAAISAECTM